MNTFHEWKHLRTRTGCCRHCCACLSGFDKVEGITNNHWLTCKGSGIFGCVLCNWTDKAFFSWTNNLYDEDGWIWCESNIRCETAYLYIQHIGCPESYFSLSPTRIFFLIRKPSNCNLSKIKYGGCTFMNNPPCCDVSWFRIWLYHAFRESFQSICSVSLVFHLVLKHRRRSTSARFHTI